MPIFHVQEPVNNHISSVVQAENDAAAKAAWRCLNGLHDSTPVRLKGQKFTFTLRHDHGTIRITAAATNVVTAMQIIMASERCPARSFLDACGEDGFEVARSGPRAGALVVLSLPASAVIRSRSNPAATGTIRPTDFMARTIDQRWRRVYLTTRDGKSACFVKHGAVKTLVTLP